MVAPCGVYDLQKNEAWARRHAGDKDPPAFLTARDVLEYATVEGARANGLERKIGTLTPGKEADIILLRTDQLNVMPFNKLAIINAPIIVPSTVPRPPLRLAPPITHAAMASSSINSPTVVVDAPA